MLFKYAELSIAKVQAICLLMQIRDYIKNAFDCARLQFMIEKKPRNTGLPQWCQKSENQYGTVGELEED